MNKYPILALVERANIGTDKWRTWGVWLEPDGTAQLVIREGLFDNNIGRRDVRRKMALAKTICDRKDLTPYRAIRIAQYLEERVRREEDERLLRDAKVSV